MMQPSNTTGVKVTLVCVAIGILLLSVLVGYNVYLRAKLDTPPVQVDLYEEFNRVHHFEDPLPMDRAPSILPAARRAAEYYEEIAEDPVYDVEEPSEHEWLAVHAVTTGYSPHAQSCYPYDDGYTSIGINTEITPWGIAACPTVLPYGTRVIVPGYKPSRHYGDDYPWTVDDTGADMRRAAREGVLHLDMRFIHQRSAMRYGRQYKLVYVDISGLDDRQRRWLQARANR